MVVQHVSDLIPLHTDQLDAPIFCKIQPSPLWSACRRLPAAAVKNATFWLMGKPAMPPNILRQATASHRSW